LLVESLRWDYFVATETNTQEHALPLPSRQLRHAQPAEYALWLQHPATACNDSILSSFGQLISSQSARRTSRSLARCSVARRLLRLLRVGDVALERVRANRESIRSGSRWSLEEIDAEIARLHSGA
jgi:hypothetical protein